MTFQPGSMGYVQSWGSSPNSVAFPHIETRDPTEQDVRFALGTRWINTTDNEEWTLTSFSSVAGTLTANWSQGGNVEATTSEFGIVQLATLAELQGGSAPAGAYVPTANDVATVIAGVVVGAVPPATTTQQGIVELATDAQVVTPFATDVPNTAVQPSNITAMFAAPEPIGSTTPNSGAFTNLAATGVGTGNTITSDTASSVGVTGAGIDLTLSSAAGRVVVNGEEAAADAVRILSAAGGLDVDVALQMNLTSSQNAVDAIRILASAGGIDIDAVGAATEDINITNTGGSIRLTATESATDAINIEATTGGVNILASGAAAGEDINITATGSSVNITATENNAGAVIVRANGGTSERVTLLASQGTAADSINLESTAGGITLTSNLATADGINLSAVGGGIDVDAALQINIASSQNAVDAIRIVASAGGIDIDAVGAATEDINITNTGGSVVVVATESVGDAIRMNASGVAGGFDIDAGTGGFIVDTTGGISLDAAAASNFTATGAFDITIQSTAGSILLNAGEAVADAVNIDSTGGFDLDAALQVNIDSSQAAATAVRIVTSNAGGGIDIDSGTGGIAIDSTGAISLDAAAASNLTVTGAGIDLTLASSGGSVLVSSTEDAALAIRLHANGGTSETIQIHSDQGTGVSSVGLLSDVGGITLRATGLASADAINLEAAAGGIDMDGALQINIASSQAAATAIQMTASDAAGGITMTVGTGGVNVAGNLNLTSVATQISMNGGAATDFIGRATLVAGTVTVANTNIAANDRIFLTRSALNGSPALGFPITTISAGASFTIDVYNAAGAAVVTDVSTFDYFIVRQN